MTRGGLIATARPWAAAVLLAAAGAAPAWSAPSDSPPVGSRKALAQSGNARPGAASPQPGLLQYEGDWAAGCDNLLQCEAIALQPEGGGGEEEPLALQLIRAGGPQGEVVLRVSGLSPLPPEIALVVDGTEAARLAVQSDEAVIRGADALRAIQAMASASTVEVRVTGRKNRDKSPLLSLSSVGLAASLRFIDTRQGRTGTPSAFVMRGTAPESAIPLPPLVPVVPQVPSPDADAAPGLDKAEMAAARRLAVCDAMLMADGVAELFSLDDDAALLLLPCEAGAYNVSAVPLIVRGKPGGRSLTIARFDFAPGFTGEPGKPPLVVNALWDARRGVLSSLAKGRGAGDCGASENYVWDGAMFRLIESRAMHVCRGAWEWIRLWEAQPKRGETASVGHTEGPAATGVPSTP